MELGVRTYSTVESDIGKPSGGEAVDCRNLAGREMETRDAERRIFQAEAVVKGRKKVRFSVGGVSFIKPLTSTLTLQDLLLSLSANINTYLRLYH